MAKTLGKNAVVQLNGTTITTWLTQSDLQRMNDLLDSATYGDTAKESTLGLVDGTFTAQALYDDVAANIDGVVNTAFGTAAGVVLNLYPVGTTSGSAYYTGTVMVRNERLGIPVGGLQTLAFDLQFSGGVTRSVV